MKTKHALGWSIPVLLIAGGPAVGQVRTPSARREAPPPGQEMTARDGDRVIIEDDARVEIVRRRQGMIRSVFSSAQRLLVVLVDYPRAGSSPDGQVDMAYSFREVEGWPLGERWEGYGVFEEYLPFSQAGPQPAPRFGVVTPQGTLLLQPGLPPEAMQKPSSEQNVFHFRGSGTSSGSRGMSFDQAEQAQLAQATRDIAGGGMGGSSTMVAGAGGGTFTTWSGSSGSAIPAGGVRVGGPIGTPQKIRDAAPVYPAQARQAKVRGVVILEITVGPDGSVTNPRVLRSIPMLDAAAIEAVRQWQYEPVLLNGVAVPAIMTVTIPFAP